LPERLAFVLSSTASFVSNPQPPQIAGGSNPPNRQKELSCHRDLIAAHSAPRETASTRLPARGKMGGVEPGLSGGSATRFDKLLFPIDNSRETSHALPLVADLAQRCKSRVYLLSVLDNMELDAERAEQARQNIQNPPKQTELGLQ